MIFGIKTRKDLKKEIEGLNKKLEEYRQLDSIRKVTVVPTTRPLVRLRACCVVPMFLCDEYPEVAQENVQKSLAAGIGKDLMKYMEVESFDDPFSRTQNYTGTLTVVVPEKGGRGWQGTLNALK